MSVPTTYKDYYGDETRWFLGTVLQVDGDPEELGRVKVRIYGVHPEDPELCSLGDLPWASVVMPSTEAGTSGYGGTTGLKPSAQVFGIFLDGKNSQLPLVLGSIPKNESTVKKRNRQQIDGNGYYDRSSNLPDYANGGGDGVVKYASFIASQTRKRQVVPGLFKILETAATAAGVTVVIFSGGQDVKGHGTKRVGSTRHDAGFAADVYVYDGAGRQLVTTGLDPVMNKFITELGAAGAQGLGAHPRYMSGTGVHVDLWGAAKGSQMWGEGGSGKPPKAIVTAFKEGLKRFYQQGIVDSTTIKNKNKEKSNAADDYLNQASGFREKIIATEGVTATDVGDEANAAFKSLSTSTGSGKVKNGPALALLTAKADASVAKTNGAVADISGLTGKTSTSAPILDEVVTQGNIKGMEAALSNVNIPATKVAGIVKSASPLPDVIDDAVSEIQSGGIEKALSAISLDAASKISLELGNPFGSLNPFGSIASGVSNIMPQMLAQSFNMPGIDTLVGDIPFVPDGVKLDLDGVKITPPPVLKDGLSNIANLVSTKESKQGIYTTGLNDANWAGANSRGTYLGGTWEFKSLTSSDHIEAEFRYAGNQRDITTLIIDSLTGVQYFEVDEIHDAASTSHQENYGIDVVNANPNNYGLQTHLFVEGRGTIKKVVPAKDKINELYHPVRQPIYDNCIHIMLNANESGSLGHRQTESLDEIIKTFMKVFPGAEILGVNDLLPENQTESPGFSVRPYVLRKFGKDTTIEDITVKSVPKPKELANKFSINSVAPQASWSKLPDINQVLSITKTLDFDLDLDLLGAAKSWANDNLSTIDLVRQKADFANLDLQKLGSGITGLDVSALDLQLDTKLTDNLQNKITAAANGLEFEDDEETFEAKHAAYLAKARRATGKKYLGADAGIVRV